MGREDRQGLIKEIETLRGSKVITYIISTRPSIRTGIEEQDLREIYDHLLKMDKSSKIDLFIYSLGGAGTVPWALSNMIREFTDDFTALIPNLAFSAATGIALGANKIIMGKIGTLGPVDPLVANEFNPMKGNNLVHISVEDIAGYIALLKEKGELKNEENFTKAFSTLCTAIHPLALGNAYRHYIKARADARKLLELHMNSDSIKDKQLIDTIVDTLVEKLYFHGHHISRNEAKTIGLNIQNAEEIQQGDSDLDQLMWKLFLDYENELDMRCPYKDEVTSDDCKRLVPTRLVESNNMTSAMVIEQEFHKIALPVGAILTQVSTPKGELIAFAIPAQGGYQIIPYIAKNGNMVVVNGEFYEKKEVSYWKKFNSDDEISVIAS